MTLPTDLYYSQEHVWVKQEGKQVRVGITEFAQAELGDVVFVELPDIGEELDADEPFGSVESVKTVSELYTPISGTVVKVNDDLEDHPEYLNESPYDQAWIMVIELSNDTELNGLLTDDEYLALIEDN
jgi:glycine cleavage system H protein